MEEESKEKKKEYCGISIYDDNGCSSHMTRNQTKYFILKKDNKNNVMFKRKGSLTNDDEIENLMFFMNLKDNTLNLNIVLSNMQNEEDLIVKEVEFRNIKFRSYNVDDLPKWIIYY